MNQRERGTSEALQAGCEEIRCLLEKADEDEVATRYKVGAILAKMRDDKTTYGERAIDRAAAALSKHRVSLYRYAAVADLGPWRELRPLSMKKNRDGEVVTWSHWLELGRVPSEWRRWFDKAKAEAWNARELRHRLDLALADRKPTENEPSDTTTEAFAESLRGVHRYDVEVISAVGAVLDRLERLPSRERTREVGELLARGVDLMEAAKEKSDRMLVRMRKLTGAVRHADKNTAN